MSNLFDTFVISSIIISAVSCIVQIYCLIALRQIEWYSKCSEIWTKRSLDCLGYLNNKIPYEHAAPNLRNKDTSPTGSGETQDTHSPEVKAGFYSHTAIGR